MIESPCVSVCEINPETGFCRGCWRTRDEIKDWRVADEERRLDILEHLHRRREDAGGRRRRRTGRRRGGL